MDPSSPLVLAAQGAHDAGTTTQPQNSASASGRREQRGSRAPNNSNRRRQQSSASGRGGAGASESGSQTVSESGSTENATTTAESGNGRHQKSERRPRQPRKQATSAPARDSTAPSGGGSAAGETETLVSAASASAASDGPEPGSSTTPQSSPAQSRGKGQAGERDKRADKDGRNHNRNRNRRQLLGTDGGSEGATKGQSDSIATSGAPSTARPSTTTTSTLSKPLCRYFTSPSGCASGSSCRFPHTAEPAATPKDASPAPSATAPAPPRRSTLPVCRFFQQGKCSSGENCRFRHEHAQTQPSASQASAAKVSSTSSAAAPAAPTAPQPKLVALSELSDAQLQALREGELAAISKRFGNFSVTTPGPTVALFDMTPSDPDWPYTVETIKMQATLPPKYPAEQMSIKVLPIGVPEKFAVILNKALAAQVQAMFQQVSGMKVLADQPTVVSAEAVAGQGSPAPSPFLLIRPFMRWLDKNIERLFVESGRQLRKQEEIARMGIKIISPAELRSKLYGKEAAAPDATATAAAKKDDSAASASAASDATAAARGRSAKEDEDEEDEEDRKCQKKRAEPPRAAGATASRQQSGDDIFEHVDDNQGRGAVLDASSGDSEAGEDQEGSGSDTGSDGSGTDGSGAEDDDEEGEEAEEAEELTQNKQGAAPRGTEIRLLGLQMTQVALLRMEQVHLALQCARCKSGIDMMVQAHFSPTTSCAKCNTTVSVHFRSSLVHAGSSCLGYLDLAGCLPTDCVLLDSVVSLQCFSCMQETAVKSNALVIGETRTHSCRNCHASMTVSAAGLSFVRHNQTPGAGGSGSDGGAGGSSSSGGDQANKGKKKVKVVKDPNIKLGSPLPDFGTCKHYKKSYRWFRFPCCGRAYACDVCHEEGKTDGHPIQWAKRMICGYCAKEQNYTANKPCSCGETLTGDSTTRFWEGGHGCRNKSSMSRKDKHKYSNSKMKTQSKKHERVSQKSSD